MPEIKFIKRRGITADLFNVLCMYAYSPSLNAVFRGYNIKPSDYLCESYARICDFIDNNVKEFKPFFVKSADSPEDGSIFHKITQMLMVRDEVTIFDLLGCFRKMTPKYFLAEIFRITENRPDSERWKYLRMLDNHDEVVEFIKTQNYTSREKTAIKYFYEGGDVAYKYFISFIEKLYKVVELEHKINEEKLFLYTEWLKERLKPGKDGYLFELDSFISRMNIRNDRFIVTVCLFPPYSVNCLDGPDCSVLCIGIGAFSEYAEHHYNLQDSKRENPCEMRIQVLKTLNDSPKRLMEIADELDTCSAEISYHIGALEKNGFIKRARKDGLEHFEVLSKGKNFIEKNNFSKEEILKNG
ncbi:MAG: winged helix-turn-helix transcriptional regulator [Ruminococcaceae bacterium]|nr:winged helix-turn-helix transcriptional regulator [Oscillospiraceae bacterium]